MVLKYKKLLLRIPQLGVIAFVFSYFYAAHFYPGGRVGEKYSLGYYHFKNFFCDLQDEVAIIGAVNPGYRVAIWGTILFFLSLIPLWYYHPEGLRLSQIQMRIAQVTGVLGSAFLSLMSVEHELAVNMGVILGIIGGSVTLYGVWKSGEKIGFLLPGLVLIFCVINFILWHFKLYPIQTPVFQKISLALLVLWVWSSSSRMIADDRRKAKGADTKIELEGE